MTCLGTIVTRVIVLIVRLRVFLLVLGPAAGAVANVP